MDRPIIYPLEVPAVEDLLYGWQRTLVAISKLASTVLGPSPFGAWLEGFEITASGGLAVQVANGQIYSQASIDASSYGVLPLDNNQILRQYLQDAVSTFTLAAPTTSGDSLTWLIQFVPVTQDTGEQVLQYFDVANPNVAFGGPGNNGLTQGIVRQDTCLVQALSGSPGPTGYQELPPLSGGAVGGYYVTIAYGQTTLTSADISTVPNAAPFITQKLPSTAGVNAANTFTRSQIFSKNVSIGEALTVAQGASVQYLYSPTTGTFLYNLGTTDNSNNVVLKSDGANVHIYPYGVPYGQLYFGKTTGFPVTFNGSLTVSSGNLSIAGGGSFGGTVSGADAAANTDFVTFQQVPSLIPTLFSSFNDVTSVRGSGILYTNTTGKPMFVTASGGGEYRGTQNDGVQAYINGALVANSSSYASVGGNYTGFVAFMVPPGASYQVNIGSGPLLAWTETY